MNYKEEENEKEEYASAEIKRLEKERDDKF